MMKARDYEAVASALRATLPVRLRLRVYRHLAPLLASNNPRFDPVKFAESLSLPKLFISDISNGVENYASQEEDHK